MFKDSTVHLCKMQQIINIGDNIVPFLPDSILGVLIFTLIIIQFACNNGIVITLC